MSHNALLHFLLGCTLFNYSVLIVWFLAFVFAKDALRRLHGRWFHLPDTTFDALHYGGMALYKVGILLFNLAPLIVLSLMPGGH